MDFIPDILAAFIPLWVAVVAGLLIGWSWRPRWAGALVIFLAGEGRYRLVWAARPGFCVRRVWIALTALSAFSFLKRFFRRSKASSKSADQATVPPDTSVHRVVGDSSFSSNSEDEQLELTESDLETLMSYTEETEGGPPWQLMMERSTPTLTYQAWHRDPPFGPTQYRTKTIIENVSPELMRDFFWDDEFRSKWDNMLIYFRILKEWPCTGTMIVHWIKKLPFFFSNREYIIIRRIWETGSTYYCVTKGMLYPSLPRHKSPKRVNLYYSSWQIKAVESRNGGQLTASEVLLFHYEEVGIPKELLKIGIRSGMWGIVKNLDAGIQAYQMAREGGVPPSRYAIMARIATKIQSSQLTLPRLEVIDAGQRFELVEIQQEQKTEKNVMKWLVVGGILILCGLNGGAIGKGIIFGIIKGFQKIHRK